MTATTIQNEVRAALLEATTDTGQGELEVLLVRGGVVDETAYPPTKSADTGFAFRAVQSNLSFMDMQAGNTESGDIKLMLAVGDTDPTVDDKIKVLDRLYSIESVKPIAPAGIPLYWNVIARGGVPDTTTYLPGSVLADVRFEPFFVQIADTTHMQQILAGQRTFIPVQIDSTLASSAPPEYATYDFFANGKISPIGVSDIDQYEFTFEIDVTPTIDGEVLTFDIDIGDTFSIPIKARNVALAVEAGETEKISFPFDVYTGAFFNTNGGALHITSRADLMLGRIDVKVDVVSLG